MAAFVDWVLVVEGALGARLAAVERLVTALPRLLGAALRDCDLAYDGGSGWFAAVVHATPRDREPEHRRRLEFWAHEVGGELVALAELGDAERIGLRARIALAGQVSRALAPELLTSVGRRFFDRAGAPVDRRRGNGRPVYVLDLTDPGDLAWERDDRALFVPRQRAPEPGDELQLAVRTPAQPRPLECAAEVISVRAPEIAGPGLPAGFTLALRSPPPALVAAVEARSGASAAADSAPEGGAAAGSSSPATEPRAAGRPPAPARDAADGAGSRSRRALVVDDDPFARRLLGDALAARGFHVLTAVDGGAGLRRLAEEVLRLDLLVTDLRMPRMDGGALLRTVRRAGEAALAVVVVTGAFEPGLEPALERDGADAVLDKALGFELIARAAEAVVLRKRAAA